MFFGETEVFRISNAFLGVGYAILVGLSWRTYRPFRQRFTFAHRLVVWSLMALVLTIFTSLLDYALYQSDLRSGDANMSRMYIVHDFGVFLDMVVSPFALIVLCGDRLYRIRYGRRLRVGYVYPLAGFIGLLLQNMRHAPDMVLEWTLLREDLKFGRPFLGSGVLVFLVIMTLVALASTVFIGAIAHRENVNVQKEPPKREISSRRF